MSTEMDSATPSPPIAGTSGRKPSGASNHDARKPSRRTTKRLIIANMVAAWGALVLAVTMGGDVIEHVAMPLATVIVGLFGVYTGTGHLDLRAMAQVLTRKEEGGGDDAWPS